MAKTLNIQGHRGARGHYPENTLPAFAYALSQGVDTLELDVGVTRDAVVVATHDRHLNPFITRDRTGAWLRKPTPRVCETTLEQLRAYDVGRIDPGCDYAKEFPDQQPMDGTPIPTLDEVIDLLERSGNTRVSLNIEVKTSPESPQDTLPPASTTDALLAVIRRRNFRERVIIQAFDWRIPLLVQAVEPSVVTSYLTARQPWFDTLSDAGGQWLAGFTPGAYGGSVPRAVKAAGGRIWAPYYGDVDRDLLAEAHGLGLQVMVWTVNDAQAMKELIELGVDAVISDYPARLRLVAAEHGIELPRPTPVSA